MTTTALMSAADVAAHEAASYVRPRRVLERFPAGGPRGSWPADELAARLREEGTRAEVVMDPRTDAFLVIVRNERAGVAS